METSSIGSPGPDRADQSNTCSLHIGERLSKLEQLFEKFVCRKSAVAMTSADGLQSPTLVGLSDQESSPGLPKSPSDIQSVSSIGDGIVSVTHNHSRWDAYTHSLVRRIGLRHLRFAHCPTKQRTRIHQLVTPSNALSLLYYHHSTTQISSSSPPMVG